MGTTLAGQEIKNTYQGLIKISDTTALSATAKYLSDGLGNDSVLALSNARVGIGTSSPDTALDVNGGSKFRGSISGFTGGEILLNGGNNSQVALSTNGTGSTEMYLDHRGSSTGIWKFRDTTDVRMAIIGGNVGIGTITPQGELDVKGSTNVAVYLRNSSNGDTNTDGLLLGNVGGIPASYQIWNYENGFLRFGTNASERMRIDASGNVGIGTSSPNYLLSSAGDAGLQGNENYLYFHSTYSIGNNARARMRAVGAGGGSGYGGDLRIDTRAQNNTWNTDVVTVANTGNVGIGTASPSQKLHVDGSVRITGAIYDSNNAAGTSGQVLSSTGTGTDWVSLSEISGVDGTGTANYVSKWSDTDTITNSQIQDDGTTVGIGQAPSTAKLTVSGDIQTAAPETSTASAWKLGNVGLGGVEVGPIDYITVSVGGFVVKLPIAIFPETQAFYDRVIADGGTFEGLLGYESAVTILKAQ